MIFTTSNKAAAAATTYSNNNINFKLLLKKFQVCYDFETDYDIVSFDDCHHLACKKCLYEREKDKQTFIRRFFSCTMCCHFVSKTKIILIFKQFL